MPTLNALTCDLYFEDTGGPLPPIVFLHGWCDGSESWAETIAALRGSFRCLAPDMRGHGRSGMPRDHAFFLEALSNDIVAVCKAAAVERPIVVGHSFGGLLAAVVAARFPAFARGVLVEDQALDLRPQAGALRGLAEVIFSAESHMAFRTQLFDSMVTAAMPPEGRASIARLKEATLVEVGQALWAPFFAATDAELGELFVRWARALGAQPSLIIEAQAMPEYHAAVAKLAPSARLEVVPSGHWIHLEQPEAFRALLSEFAESTS